MRCLSRPIQNFYEFAYPDLSGQALYASSAHYHPDYGCAREACASARNLRAFESHLRNVLHQECSNICSGIHDLEKFHSITISKKEIRIQVGDHIHISVFRFTHDARSKSRFSACHAEKKMDIRRKYDVGSRHILLSIE